MDLSIEAIAPLALKQWGAVSNMTVVDSVPQEMLSLIDPHW